MPQLKVKILAFQVCVNNYYKYLQEEKWKFSSNSSHARNTLYCQSWYRNCISLSLTTESYDITNNDLGCFFMKSNLRYTFQCIKKPLAVYGRGFIKILSEYKFYIFHIIFAGFALSVCFSVLAVLQQYWKRRKPKVISLQLIKKLFNYQDELKIHYLDEEA